MPDKKPPLTKDGLARHGVEYDPRLLAANDPLPDHVDLVRDVLLDFTGRIPYDSRRVLESNLTSTDPTYTAQDNQPHSVRVDFSPLPESDECYWRMPELPGARDQSDAADLQETLVQSREIATHFKEYEYDPEAAWTRTLIGEIFQSHRQKARNRHPHS